MIHYYNGAYRKYGGGDVSEKHKTRQKATKKTKKQKNGENNLN